jgi:hypothetical protein
MVIPRSAQPWSWVIPSFVSLEKPSMPIVHFVQTTRIKGGLLKGTLSLNYLHQKVSLEKGTFC